MLLVNDIERQKGIMSTPGRDIASGVAARVAKYKQLGEVAFVEVRLWN